jgi:hypothetical protein
MTKNDIIGYLHSECKVRITVLAVLSGAATGS